MADGPSLTEILVSRLGTPSDPFDMGDVLGVCVLVVAVMAYASLEYGLGRLVARLLGLGRAKARQDQKPPGGS